MSKLFASSTKAELGRQPGALQDSGIQSLSRDAQRMRASG